MTKYLIGFFLILNSFNCAAQYKSMFSSNDYWNIYNIQYYFSLDNYVDSLYLDGKISYNNKDYFTLYSNYTILDTGCPQCFYGYVREDTVIGKAWYLQDTLGFMTEQLIYDLSLTKNDTFVVDSGASNETKLIVDTSYQLNNRKIIRLTLLNNDSFELENARVTAQASYKYDSLLFIEGIGTTKGFDARVLSGHSVYNQGHSHRLLCVFDTNQVKVFQHQLTPTIPFLVDCDTVHLGVPVGLNEISSPYKIELFPNPVNDFVTIKYLPGIKQILLYNAHGQKIQEKTPNKSVSTKVYLPSAPGIYFIHFEMENGITVSRKVIKL